MSRPKSWKLRALTLFPNLTINCRQRLYQLIREKYGKCICCGNALAAKPRKMCQECYENTAVGQRELLQQQKKSSHRHLVCKSYGFKQGQKAKEINAAVKQLCNLPRRDGQAIHSGPEVPKSDSESKLAVQPEDQES